MNPVKSILSLVGLSNTRPPKETPSPTTQVLPPHGDDRGTPSSVSLCEVFCFDNSLSMREGPAGRSRRDILRESFRHRVQKLKSLPHGSVLLGSLRFSGVYHQNLWWTGNLDDADDSLFAHEFANDGTSFCAALEGALLFLGRINEPRAFRRVVLFTDGHHNVSGDPVAVAEAVKRTGAQLVCVGCADQEADVDMAMLNRMASLDECGRPCVEFAGTPGELVRFMTELDTGLERWPA